MSNMKRYRDIENEMLDEALLLCKNFILRCSKRDTDIDIEKELFGMFCSFDNFQQEYRTESQFWKKGGKDD